jgi:hypothetical protein
MISKAWAIKLACEAARTVLSVDQIIVARQAGGPKPPAPNPVSDFSRSLSTLADYLLLELGRGLKGNTASGTLGVSYMYSTMTTR